MRSELLRQLLALTLASSEGILAALALRRFMRRVFGAGASYVLWLLVPIAMLAGLLPHVQFTVLAVPIRALPVTTSALTHALDRSFDSLATAASAPIDGVPWTVGVWEVGAVMFALYLGGLQRAFVKSLGTMSGRHCVLRAQHSVGCPALIGVLWPKVVLPADFRARYTPLERLLVLSHERTHLRRGDAGWNALAALMRCIFWFNPLIHVAARYFRFDQELACDAVVLRARRGWRRPYASAMLKTQLTEGALPIGCHWRSAQDLKERLRMVSRRPPNRRRRIIGSALTTLVAIGVAYAAWAAEPVAGSTATPAASASTGGQAPVSWTAAWTGWLSPPTQAPDEPVVTVMHTHQAQLFFPPGVKPQSTADMVNSSIASVRPQTVIMEGHVRLTFTAPSAAGAANPQTIVVEANRAVVVEQPGGGLVVQVEEAAIRTVRPPEIVTLSMPQSLPELLTPNSITPNFKDAAISQVAAAVALATHRTIIVDPRVHAQLNMLSSAAMTPDAFYQAFLDILHTRGFVAAPVGPSGDVIRILPGAND